MHALGIHFSIKFTGKTNGTEIHVHTKRKILTRENTSVIHAASVTTENGTVG